jgi:hypothetical protein
MQMQTAKDIEIIVLRDSHTNLNVKHIYEVLLFWANCCLLLDFAFSQLTFLKITDIGAIFVLNIQERKISGLHGAKRLKLIKSVRELPALC